MNQREPALEVEAVVECTSAQKKSLGGKDECVNIVFNIYCVQHALLQELINRLQDQKFDKEFEKELKDKQGLHVSAFAVNGHIAMGQVVSLVAKITFYGGGLFALGVFGIGYYKLQQLQKSGQAGYNRL